MDAIKRVTNTKLLRKWIQDHAPNGKEKLVRSSKDHFSVALVDKILTTGKAPKLANRLKIAQATGLPIDELFPEEPRSPKKR